MATSDNLIDSRYTLEQSTDAMTFARIMISSLELSSEQITDPRVNPFNITPVCLDETVSSSIRDIFRNIGYEKMSWDKLGVKYMPNRLKREYGEQGVDSKFTVSGCELMDCFGYSDLSGTRCSECGPFNVKLDNALSDREIVGCRPSCFLFQQKSSKRVPNDVHIYYDYDNNVCRLGCPELRIYSQCPRLRSKENVPGTVDVPPFYFDTQMQRCFLSEAYCKGFKVMKFDEKTRDCYLPVGRQILEVFLGTSLTRRGILATSTSDEYNIRKLEISEQNRRRLTALRNRKKLNHLENVNSIIHNNYTSEVNQKENQKSIAVIEKLGHGSLKFVEFVGAVFGTKFALKCVKHSAEKISAMISEKLITHVAEMSAARGIAVLGTYFAERTAVSVAAKSATVFLDALASAVNPALIAIDVCMIASMIWDPFDTRFNVVTAKSELDDIQRNFIRKWNLANNGTTETDRLAMFEVKPRAVYTMIFGDYFDDVSRNAQQHIQTMMYYSDKYLSAIDEENDNLNHEMKASKQYKIQEHHVDSAKHSFLSAFLAKIEYSDECAQKELEQQKLFSVLISLITATILPLIVWNLFTMILFLALVISVIFYMSVSAKFLRKIETEIELKLKALANLVKN